MTDPSGHFTKGRQFGSLDKLVLSNFQLRCPAFNPLLKTRVHRRFNGQPVCHAPSPERGDQNGEPKCSKQRRGQHAAQDRGCPGR